MVVETKKSALSRLQALADDMKKTYPKVVEKAKTAMAPIEAAIMEIDETFRPAHLPELVRDHGSQAKASPACFAQDTLTDGSETEYLLCVARGPDSKCHVHVSSCKYDLKSLQEANKERLDAAIREATLLQMTDLPVRLKAMSIHALDDFAEAYERHVLAMRQSLLDGTPVEGPEETSAPMPPLETTVPSEETPPSAPVPEPEAKVHAAPPPQPEPVQDPQPEVKEDSEATSEPDVPQVDTDAATEIQDPLVGEIEEHAKELSAASAALDLPAEQWIPTGH